MKYPYYKITFLSLLFLVCISRSVFAAQFIASSSAQTIHVGDQFEVSILLNTDGENANALGGSVVYPQNLLELKEIRNGNSIVNFWVDAPTSTADGIIFSGITPGGYVGESGLIVSLIFTAKASGQGDILITNGQLLRNDGAGSKIPLTVSDFQFSISGNGQNGGFQILPIKDNQPPESFVPEVSQNSDILNGKWFVVFSTSDKGSGVDHYEVKESKYKILDFSKWYQTDSPYFLTDQNLQSYIYVKAVDVSGNTRIEVVSPAHPLAFYENVDDWFILILIILCLLFYKKLVWKKHT